jgi:hypothetical protein
MKLILFIIIVLLTITGCSKNIVVNEVYPIPPHSFESVWNEVSSNPLNKLPQNNVLYSKLSKGNVSTIFEDAKRTLNNKADILASFDKLAHPNGICFKGTWSINKKNIYTGYFKKDSKALIIVRASTALSNTTSAEKRAFGFAGKIFPTMDSKKVNKESTANFFLVDDLGGTDSLYYTESVLINEPKVSFTYELFKNLFYAIKVANTFEKSDKNSGIRQLYEISQLGEIGKSFITPKWLKLDASDNKKVLEKDFRDELKIKNDKKLVFKILVASKIVDDKKNWNEIGIIILDTSIISNSCDHRLHFHHPKFVDGLDYGE